MKAKHNHICSHTIKCGYRYISVSCTIQLSANYYKFHFNVYCSKEMFWTTYYPFYWNFIFFFIEIFKCMYGRGKEESNRKKMWAEWMLEATVH